MRFEMRMNFHNKVDALLALFRSCIGEAIVVRSTNVHRRTAKCTGLLWACQIRRQFAPNSFGAGAPCATQLICHSALNNKAKHQGQKRVTISGVSMYTCILQYTFAVVSFGAALLFGPSLN